MLAGCRGLDRPSQRQFYQEYYGFALSICLRYLHDRATAVEAVNDGFLKVFQELPLAGHPALANHAPPAAAPAGEAALAVADWAAAHRPTPLRAVEGRLRVAKLAPAATVAPKATVTRHVPTPQLAPDHFSLAVVGVANPQLPKLGKGLKEKSLPASRAYTTDTQPGHFALEAPREKAPAFASRLPTTMHPAMMKNSADYQADGQRETELGQPAASAAAAQPDSVALLAARRLPATALGPLPDTLAPLSRAAADSARPAPRPLARPAYRLLLGVVGAPSVSAVRTAQTARLGGDFGLTLEYRFTPRLRLRTGLISSQKRYSAASADYQAPASWQWFAADYQVKASCRITEIPLDLRFDVLRRPRYTVFASLGATSLLLRDERYSYDWMMNGQTFTKEAHIVKGSNSWLGVLSFSAGIERPLGARWALQAEPFWQVPLGRVGAGRVRLSSAGLSFGLKYGLLR